MPAGVGWGEYLRFLCAAMLTFAAGSQAVHVIYKPLDGLEDLIAEREREIRKQQEPKRQSVHAND